MKRALPILFAVMLVAGAALGPAHATIFTLSSNNSSVAIDTDLAGGFNSGGALSWRVDGVTQLFQQTWFYRVGDTLQAPLGSLSSTFTQPAPNFGQINYTGSGFTLSTTYTLLGGGSGSMTSDLSEQALVTNTSGAPLDFHLYLYTDFDLGGTLAGDTVSIDAQKDDALQTGNGWTADTVVVPDATHAEAALFPSTLDHLKNVVAYTLNDALGPVGPAGDVTWAFEWDVLLAASGPNSSFLISIDKNISHAVPEPTTMLLLGSGLIGLWGARKKFRK